MIGPTKKRSKAKKHARHSAWKKVKIKYWVNKIQTRRSDEGQCWKLTHRVCPKSGFYKGRQVLNIKQRQRDTIIDA